MDKALKKLNEEKNTINCDIDMIRWVNFTMSLILLLKFSVGLLVGKSHEYTAKKTFEKCNNYESSSKISLQE